MEEHINPLAVTHLLQHTLRSLCSQENSQWIYAVFWRILPRNYPPPKWEGHGAYDRSRGNRRNWILVWEDGFCNFGASASPAHDQINSSNGECPGGPSVYGGDQFQHHQYYHGLQPELFFKMSHEIYNYGEGLIGKVAADHSHKWIYKEPNDQHQEINFLSAWHNSADSHPRTWEAQFQSGIKTIALIAVREGVVQLGAINKVVEDLSYVVLLRKKLSYIESIPGVLLPHPSSPSFPSFKLDPHGYGNIGAPPDHHSHAWHNFQGMGTNATNLLVPPHPSTTHDQYYEHHFNMNHHQVPMLKNITPSMSSLEALLSKLPSVVPSPPNTTHDHHQFPESSHHHHHGGGTMQFMATTEQMVVAKEETDVQEEEEYMAPDHKNVSVNAGESSTSMSAAYGCQQPQHFHHH
ncbi:protein RICE SALT SENSITIVE 3-like [Rosa sericea]